MTSSAICPASRPTRIEFKDTEAKYRVGLVGSGVEGLGCAGSGDGRGGSGSSPV